MQHQIDTKKFGALGEPMAEAVKTCVHCGFCLAASGAHLVLAQVCPKSSHIVSIVKLGCTIVRIATIVFSTAHCTNLTEDLRRQSPHTHTHNNLTCGYCGLHDTPLY